MLEVDDARDNRLIEDACDVEATTFDEVERFRLTTGDILDGDVDNGEAGSCGDALLLLDIGGLEDHLESLSLEQAGIVALLAPLAVFETIHQCNVLPVTSQSRSVEIFIPRSHTLILRSDVGYMNVTREKTAAKRVSE